MYKIDLTGLELCTIIAALDDARVGYRMRAIDADALGHESRAKNHYDTAARYETIITMLQAQMKGDKP